MSIDIEVIEQIKVNKKKIKKSEFPSHEKNPVLFIYLFFTFPLF